MNGTARVLHALHHGEQVLAQELAVVAARHPDEPEVRHVIRDLARWSNEHGRHLVEAGLRYGLHLDDPSTTASEPFTSSRHPTVEPVGGGSGTVPVLLRDLRELHLAAAGNALYWVMLTQAARASKDSALLDIASFCHPRTLRQMQWTTTLISTLSPQLLTI